MVSGSGLQSSSATGAGDPASPLIVAPATPAGRSALAIVRWSGSGVRAHLRSLLLETAELPDRRPALRTVVDGEGTPIDRGLLTFFPAPASFTGEESAEFSGHGSPRLQSRIVAAALASGARLAEPGEFSARALRNGRLDLSQAEAIDELIRSETDWGERLALGRLTGVGSGGAFRELRRRLRPLLARIEGEIDFGESDGAEAEGELVHELQRFRREVEAALAGSERLSRQARGWRLVLVGAPNAGKSTIFNRLVGHERVLVTPIAGTTRDSVKEQIELMMASVFVIDTAGIADGGDIVSRAAVDRTRQEIGTADGRLVVVGPDGRSIEQRVAAGRRLLDGAPGLILVSQVDDGVPVGEAEEGEGWLALSARTGWRWDRLLRRLEELVGGGLGEEASQECWLGEHRRRRAAAAVEALRRGEERLAKAGALDLAAAELREALALLGEATGDEASEALLGEIFSSFCIGK
jgi:tRNA modification GTPase